jgi:hypothetical protein
MGLNTCFKDLLRRYYQNGQVKEDEIGRVCSMYGKEEECIQRLSGEKN